MSIILACAIAGILGVPAKADETVKYRTIYYTTSVQSQNIPDTDGHIAGIVHAVGVASFPDGSTAADNFTAIIDYTKGTGPGVTYSDITFSDGSALFIKYAGTTTAEGPRSTFKLTATIIGGKGRFAGAKGDGTSVGARLAPQPGAGAQIYTDVTLNIKQ
jgi:hypothetical protein